MTLRIIACAVGLTVSWGALPATAQTEPQKAAAPESDVSRVAAMIDARIQAVWKDAGITPAPTSGDAEFCRRVHLAIAGRIPHVAEIRDFLGDTRSDKRRRLVSRLLESNGYVNHFTKVWRKILMPEAATDVRARLLVSTFDDWLSRQLVARQTRFDDIVRRIIVTPLTPIRSRRISFPTPQAFYQAKENKPENIAAATSRMFLGIRLECAQCHEHPSDNWSQKQFWSYAAFFSRVRRNLPNNLFSQIRDSFDRRQITIPDTEVVVSATLLDGSQPVRKQGQTARQALADWITSPSNPYFAKATVNRIWAELFGRGIVDPVDDMSESNPPSHPKLLDQLAKELVAHNYDLKFLIRAITASQAYQRSSRQTHASQEDGQLFSRRVPQPMTAEQVMSSLSVALGRPNLNRRRNIATPNPNEIFDLFGGFTESSSERQATILQSLAMMNGKLIADATKLGTGTTLTAISEAPWMKTEDRVRALFLASLSRQPTAEELTKMVAHVDRGGSAKSAGKGLGDVFWILLNSSEFLLSN